MVARNRTLGTLLSTRYTILNYILLTFSFATSCLTFTYANATLTCAQMDTAMKTVMESVTHDPEVYAHHHEGFVRWMERVLRAAGINQA